MLLEHTADVQFAVSNGICTDPDVHPDAISLRRRGQGTSSTAVAIPAQTRAKNSAEREEIGGDECYRGIVCREGATSSTCC